MKTILTTFLSLFLLVPLYSASSESPAVYTSYFNSNAVGGYDTVSYFTEGKAVKGDKKIKTEYLGVQWLFSNTSNLELFKAAPAKYAPQYGGYCAYAVAKNDLVSADPEAWKIVDGKLYLNYSKSIQKTWEADQPGYIESANKNWPTIRN